MQKIRVIVHVSVFCTGVIHNTSIRISGPVRVSCFQSIGNCDRPPKVGLVCFEQKPVSKSFWKKIVKRARMNTYRGSFP